MRANLAHGVALLLVTAIVPRPTTAQSTANTAPYLAYVRAAGGRRGEVVHVQVGGRNLRAVREVLVSGEGVTGHVVAHQRANPLQSTDVRREIGRRLQQAMAKQFGRSGRGGRSRAPETPVELPTHPLLDALDALALDGLQKVRDEFLDPAHRAQTTAQLGEVLELELLIEPDAALGERDLRLRGPRGSSNPRPFHVSDLPELTEREPNDRAASGDTAIDVPCIVNGTVGFRDVDRFDVRVRAGHAIRVDVQARRLIPYLADAVPGWFQARLALYDAQGVERAFVDDHAFDPDPWLVYEPPSDGVVTLELRDALHRGREDFVYRMVIDEVDAYTPLGPAFPLLASANVVDAGLTSSLEEEPNDAEDVAQRGTLPLWIDGRIERPGDVDRYRFMARAGTQVVAEIEARRLGSPLDAVLYLEGPHGNVLAWNDDAEDPGAGLVTHQADAYLRATLTEDGAYVVRVSDVRGQGSAKHAYRLRLSTPRPDFELRVTPATINLVPGLHTKITAHVVRRDGFEGPITLSLGRAPRGLHLSGGRIPAGVDRVDFTIAAPVRGLDAPTRVEFVGRANIQDAPVTHAARPADVMMQAFLPTHVVCAHEAVVDSIRTRGRGRALALRIADAMPLSLTPGRTQHVRLLASTRLRADGFAFALHEPPTGIHLESHTIEGNAVRLTFAVDPDVQRAIPEGNLLVTVQPTGSSANGARAGTTLGFLPAVPYRLGEDVAHRLRR
ncbi:MAG: PPC domain-containing protein [Planctomycetes bacterium]|nr:PPC domain-containing protein [Planctomycetota bacterium]